MLQIQQMTLELGEMHIQEEVKNLKIYFINLELKILETGLKKGECR